MSPQPGGGKVSFSAEEWRRVLLLLEAEQHTFEGSGAEGKALADAIRRQLAISVTRGGS